MKGSQILLVYASDSGDRLTKILHNSSWQVQATHTFREAMEHLSRNGTPVVICESSLPDGSWKDLLYKTRRLIVISCTADEALWAEVLNLGGYDVLAQPFDETEVRRVVQLAERGASVDLP
jgi:DNA-binding response OmpR family regulator